jgi:hypothetical protein
MEVGGPFRSVLLYSFPFLSFLPIFFSSFLGLNFEFEF